MPTKPKTATAEAPTISAVKGFAADWTCRGFAYEIGKTYTHDGSIAVCEAGFHACPEHPLDVFQYYAPAGSRYAEVTLAGDIARDEGDPTKIAAAKITIGVELSIGDLVKRAWHYVWSRCTIEEGGRATGYRGAASATGDSGAASATGDSGAASATGDSGAASATGDSGAASATGYRGAASATGDSGAASATGDSGAASATGYRGAASATGDSGAASATGDSGAASATGTSGAASATGDSGAASATGDSGAASATGYRGAAMACGYSGRVMGAAGNALFLAERDADGDIIAVWAGIVGRDEILADTWYTLRDGKPVEA